MTLSILPEPQFPLVTCFVCVCVCFKSVSFSSEEVQRETSGSIVMKFQSSPAPVITQGEKYQTRISYKSSSHLVFQEYQARKIKMIRLCYLLSIKKEGDNCFKCIVSRRLQMKFNLPVAFRKKNFKQEGTKLVLLSEVKSLSRVRLFATPWTVANQAPPSMGFSRQEYQSGLPFPSPGDLPDPRIEPRSLALQADALLSPGNFLQGLYNNNVPCLRQSLD